ncbi:MAG: O-antigen ligase family protein [Terriglobia bacterium]
MTLGMVGAGAAALFICAHWSIALVGAVVVLVLSAVESEPFLLFIIFLTPLGWWLMTEGQLRDLPGAVRSLVIVGFFLSRLWRGRVGVRRLLSSSPAWASLFFLGAIMVSIIFVKGGWSDYSAHGLYRIGSCLGFFFLISAWADSPERVRKILLVLLYSTIITSVFAILQEIVGGFTSFWLYLNPPGDDLVEWKWRATSFLNYPNSLAGYLNLVLPFALACYVLGQGKWKKLGGWTVGLGFVALLGTQSVGGLLAFVSILVLAVFCFARNRKKRLVLLAGICASVCLLYVQKQVLNPAHTEEAFGSEALSRLVLWGTAWGYFMHSPVTGIGWGNFVGLYGSDLSAFSAWIPPGQFAVHNIYLQLLAETGLVGFAAFFYLVGQSWRQAWGQLRSSRDFLDLALAFGVLGALLSVLVHGFVDFLFQVSPQFGSLFWGLLGLQAASARLGSPDSLTISRSFGPEPPIARGGKGGLPEIASPKGLE